MMAGFFGFVCGSYDVLYLSIRELQNGGEFCMYYSLQHGK